MKELSTEEGNTDKAGEWRGLERRDEMRRLTRHLFRLSLLNLVERISQYRIQWVKTRNNLRFISSTSLKSIFKYQPGDLLLRGELWGGGCLRCYLTRIHKANLLSWAREAVTWRRPLVAWQPLLAYQTCTASLNTSNPHPNTHTQP